MKNQKLKLIPFIIASKYYIFRNKSDKRCVRSILGKP